MIIISELLLSYKLITFSLQLTVAHVSSKNCATNIVSTKVAYVSKRSHIVACTFFEKNNNNGNVHSNNIGV